ncbi:WD40-repeat-containing domain protein [Melampsora americana]|nr:WD40-repeat-containing domain protein [Melampsora americana]
MDALVSGYGSDEEMKETIPSSQPAVHKHQEEQEVDDEEQIDLDGDVFGIKNSIASSKASKAKISNVELDSRQIISIPDVLPSTEDQSSSLILRPTDTEMNVNVKYTDMTLPKQGPQNPFSSRKLEKMNTLNGYIEEEFMTDVDFNRQQRTFHVLKYAKNPSILASTSENPSLNFVGDVHAAYKNGGTLASEIRITKATQKATKRKRQDKGELGVFDEDEEEEEEVQQEDGTTDPKPKASSSSKSREYKGPWAGWNDEHIEPVGPDEEEYEAARRASSAASAAKKQFTSSNQAKREIAYGEEKSTLHAKSLHDYQGRTYMHIPTDLDTDLLTTDPPTECFVPKRCVHTWAGHTKGVSAIRLFPGSGHLLLSASMDSRVKLWDVYHDGKCLRTFMGHSKAVRDVTFTNDGKRFLSAAYDRQIKLWDTETGHCVQAFSNGKIPYCVKFHPDPEKQHIFLAGMSDKKIIQYDMRSGDITQEYDQHLGPVNTITFVDENRRFVTTSDDKTIRAWDFDIPVVIKYIAEPAMHSMPAVGIHPNNKWLAMQSLDNQILIYSSDSFKQNRKKRFAGHTIAGYACEVGFSPDGRFLSSGDGNGSMIFWDWKSCRISKRLKCHDQVVISHAWLPHETSKLVTASWDGLIKLWD